LDRYESSELNQIEAAELLGVTERTFRRWCVLYEKAGEAGLLDRRLGAASGKRVPLDREEEVEALYRTRYSGFTARHFHEHLERFQPDWNPSHAKKAGSESPPAYDS
jgi:transposase